QTLPVAARRENPAKQSNGLLPMSHDLALFGFPLWLRLTHYINFLFLTLLIRSGIQILSDHPRLYWNKHCTPGSEWIKFTKNVVPKGKLWTSMDEAVNVSPWIALPGGRHNLGMGRHWHFFAVVFVLAPLSILTGAAMSPAVDARFPWYPRLFGNRQNARSLHFLAMAAYVIFRSEERRVGKECRSPW